MIDLKSKLGAAKARTITPRTRPTAYKLSSEENEAIKLCLFGHWGTGKSFIIVALLLKGERVLVMSSDFGNNGLITVKNELKARGRLDLLDNLLVLDVATYDDVMDALESTEDFVPDLKTFDPTVFMWEGFSTYNVDILDEYVLSMAPGAANAGELRHAGFTHQQQDWQGIKRGTLRPLRKFLAWVSPTGRRVHKVLTTLESKSESNELEGKVQKGPLVQGSGRNIFGGGFDCIIECFKEVDKEGGVKYFYRCSGSSEKYAVKNRGFKIDAITPADPEKLWGILKGDTE